MGPEHILSTYDRVAADFDKQRGKSLFERAWLDRMLAIAPPPRRVLDLGCGSGRPIASYLMDRRAQVTGVDGAAAMVALFTQNVPGAEAIQDDMRTLALGRRFDAVLAWNSFFHLCAEDQRGMFAVFAAHTTPGAALMFTAGHKEGEVMGHAAGQPVFHASLDPEEYRALLDAHGFEELRYVPEDPDCNGHTVWLARRRNDAG
ncbi:Methyltransferase [Candidatus Rhodobacter oscarellae]|uniref:Methyltransferase n=1 Tax=Candidatus Rhodobacter oscarellae TaxID=1675527 RepID=A0A0J9E506_9RHOB|nr:class I SAM-dependent methyltransferase [Candidatus Rhodobacter lobularis]KMW57885.1 Methyltransferase [Candidatus Rhodobacter lobularis]